MIKGVLLSLSVSVFIVSLIISSSSLIGSLQENILTGAFIGTNQVASYCLVALVISFIAGFFIIKIMKH